MNSPGDGRTNYGTITIHSLEENATGNGVSISPPSVKEKPIQLPTTKSCKRRGRQNSDENEVKKKTKKIKLAAAYQATLDNNLDCDTSDASRDTAMADEE